MDLIKLSFVLFNFQQIRFKPLNNPVNLLCVKGDLHQLFTDAKAAFCNLGLVDLMLRL